VVQAQALRSAEPVALAAQAAALRPAEPVAEDAAAVLLPAAGHAPVAPQQAAEEAWVAAAAPRRAVRDAAAVLRPEAVGRAWAEEARRRVARDAAAVLLRVAPGAAAVLPSAALWVFRRDRVLPSPVPQPGVRFALAMEAPRIALP
jgi:hypothetical protein